MAMPSANDLKNLSVDDRLLLIEKIWQTIENESLRLSDDHKKILDERMEDYRKNPNQGVSWDQVKSELSTADAAN